MDIPYLREIEGVEWVAEVIAERFGNAPELMTPNSVIYGGAIRDALAGLPLLGDLDIAVPPKEQKALQHNFEQDVRWDSPNSGRSPFAGVKGSPYEEPVEQGQLPMQDIIEYVTFENAIAQLMVSDITGKDLLAQALGMARQVDFLCCSVVMLSDGRIFETLEGGHQDCLDRVLRINSASSTIYLKALPSRIEKLVARGWESTVDVEEVNKRVEAERKKEERKKMRQHRAAQKRHKQMFAAAKEQVIGPAYTRKASPTEIVDHPLRPGWKCIRLGPAVMGKWFPGVKLREIVAETVAAAEIEFETRDGIVHIMCQQTIPLVHVRGAIDRHMNHDSDRLKPYYDGKTERLARAYGGKGVNAGGFVGTATGRMKTTFSSSYHAWKKAITSSSGGNE